MNLNDLSGTEVILLSSNFKWRMLPGNAVNVLDLANSDMVIAFNGKEIKVLRNRWGTTSD